MRDLKVGMWRSHLILDAIRIWAVACIKTLKIKHIPDSLKDRSEMTFRWFDCMFQRGLRLKVRNLIRIEPLKFLLQLSVKLSNPDLRQPVCRRSGG